MWKEIAFLCFGLSLGITWGYWIASKLYKPLVGDDFEINKPKIKGEDNILQVFQSNKKDTTTDNSNVKKKRFKLLKRKNK